MLSLILFTLSTALAAPPGISPGLTPGLDPKAGDGERLMRNFAEIAERLELTPEQKTKVEELYYENKKTAIDLKAKSDRSRLELKRVMLSTTTFDEKAALKAFEESAAAETDTRRNDLKLMLAVRKTLTVEQWSELVKMRAEGHIQHVERDAMRKDRQPPPPGE